uniref:NAD-dependent epimerase/dehydratase domain-containing protein n=1 Tax=Compsopogon caeruleus TaxID=31354 RepID=A0A7S1XCI1_9RHOD|mmetsp:Transcript_14453/g.29557  ORF Transcript_14453/g.29557 Transcript_14453/m.29557 type:complete len:377 (+) Transcript_14453:71-1201(+)
MESRVGMMVMGRVGLYRGLSISTRGSPTITWSGPASLESRGSGGRSSVSGIVAAVFGSTGFLGRYVVNQLGRVGSQVMVGWRGDELDYRHLRPMGDLGQVVPMEMDLRDRDSLHRMLRGANTVINLIGKPYPTRYYSLHDVHVEGAETLAEVAREHGITTFIHVSCANPDPKARSEWVRTKAAGEEAVRRIIPSATIIRPCDMFGMEDRFLTRMARCIVNQPVVLLVDDGDHKVQPVYVNDVASVIASAAEDPEFFRGKVVALGGPRVCTVRDVFNFTVENTRRHSLAVPLPRLIADPIMRLSGLRFPFINNSPTYTHDDVRREVTDDILPKKADEVRFEDLDIVPADIFSDVGNEILRQFRKGGDRSSLFYVDSA